MSKCKCCKVKKGDVGDIGMEYTFYHPEERMLKTEYAAYSCDSDMDNETVINFCPLCGRDLR